MIGARIQRWREKRGVSRDVFAQLCGMRAADLVTIEQDRVVPKPIELRRIAEVLRIDEVTLREGPCVIRKGVADESHDF